MSKILITGASGQLGTELRYLFDNKKINYEAPSSHELNIRDSNHVDSYFEKELPAYVFHCAAYTAVDQAEDSKDENWAVNAIGTENIAKASQKVGATLVYISTDYVFDGEKTEKYSVEDSINPRNEYGKAKLAGEQAVQQYCNEYYIVRTSWVFGEYGNNFVYTMLRLAKSYDRLTVVADQFGRPTWTKTLADFLLYIYMKHPDYGIYHLSNDGSCSWHDFACEILKNNDIEIEPITSVEYPQIAYRPKNSIMNLEKTKKLGFEIPTWKEALEDFLKSLELKGN